MSHHSLDLHVRGLKPSPTLAIHEESRRLLAAGRDVYLLGLGQSPFPVPTPVVEALRQNAHQKDYLPVRGLPELREAVAAFHRAHEGIPAEADGVLIGPGSKELLFLLQLTYYGDLVVPTPCWVSYAPQARIVGREVVYLPTRREDRWRLHPEDLDRLCRDDPDRPRLLVLNYPGNPDGMTCSPDHLAALAEVARRYEVVVLADEIYGKLHHEGAHVSIARSYPEGTILSSGLSKWCGAGGWRLGTFTFPRPLRWLLDAMAAVASETFTSTSAPIQHAAVRAFRGGYRIETYLVHVRRVLRALGRWCAARLAASGAAVDPPEGAFYLFPDLEPLRGRLAPRGVAGSVDLCARVLSETGVALLPGVAFGRPAGELTARLAYVDFDGARALAAVEQIPPGGDVDEAFLRTYCHRTVRAIELLCGWMEAL